MAETKYYFSKNQFTMVPTNRWDLIALVFIFGIIALLAYGTKQMAAPYLLGQTIPISLATSHLPEYALRTVLRMFFALGLSLLFTFTFGALAAKNKHAGRIIIPMIDILQSVPVLGFLSITVPGFIALFRGSLLGPECAAIFAIFTAQAWNMTLSFYQSLRTVPHDFIEAGDMYHLSAWQKFWRIEVPFAMPALLWNTMMSMSASWFFVVASEAISVANQQITLPGVGSYIALAIKNADTRAVINAIVTMLVVILLYDQILFRPLIKWAEKFKLDGVSFEKPTRNWLTKFLQRSVIFKFIGIGLSHFSDAFVNLSLFKRNKIQKDGFDPKWSRRLEIIWNVTIIILLLMAIIFLGHFIVVNVTIQEIIHVLLLGLATGARVLALIIFCTLVWIPLGVWIGFRPHIAQIAQPIMQFLAAFPAYLLFPVIVIFIVHFKLNVQIWVTTLMILGTQWYVAFNVIAGTIAIPKDLHLAINNFGVRGWLKWRRFILPCIFPYYVTGAITAVGGAWNASIVAEIIQWGNTTLKATGLGAYITEYTAKGDYAHIALGISVMCLYVLLLNRVFWRPLYEYAERHFRLD